MSSWAGLEQGLGRIEVKIFITVGHWLMKLYTTPSLGCFQTQSEKKKIKSVKAQYIPFGLYIKEFVLR